ncbi:hypothetical protein TanjilG_32346 [Lupinus angustifolius]|uniref:Uncharacterized protein n=1 Tax=Lupinus angustifolius TaxID=3871 RepID=A0A4P1R0E4_LUPAN|nr:hypothetical protein TanjilG_32346 [Lupinus angustifolius]
MVEGVDVVTHVVGKIEENVEGSYGHGLDLHMDMNVMEKQNWFTNLLSSGDETLPFGDVNPQNQFWPNQFFN